MTGLDLSQRTDSGRRRGAGRPHVPGRAAGVPSGPARRPAADPSGHGSSPAVPKQGSPADPSGHGFPPAEPRRGSPLVPATFGSTLIAGEFPAALVPAELRSRVARRRSSIPVLRRAGRPGLLGLALMCCGAAMLPWLGVLAVWVPATTTVSHWSTAWIGLDALEGAGMLLTGWLLRRGDPRRCLAAMATAVLLTVDAWFDVTTSAPGSGLLIAVAMAVCAELPVAALCTVLALRAVGRPRGEPRAGAGPAAQSSRRKARLADISAPWGVLRRVRPPDRCDHPAARR